MDVDTQGRIYVCGNGANVAEVYPGEASGDVPPLTTYGGTNTGIKAPEAVAVTPPMSILTKRIPRGHVGRHHRVALRAAEGTTPYRWSLRRGQLPHGLHLSRRGVISGVPSRAGRWRFTVQVRDASHPRVTLVRRLTVTIRRR